MRQRRSDRKKNKHTGRKLSIFLVIMLIVLFSSGYYVKAQIEEVVYTETFYPGISVNGVSLAGMTMAEAKQALMAKVHEESEKYGLVLKYEDKVWEFNYEVFNIESNLDEILETAYDLGRTGALLKRYSDIRDLAKNSMDYELSLKMSIKQLQNRIKNIVDEINVEAVNATIEFHPNEDKKFTITPEKTGLYLDINKLMNELEKAFLSQTYVVKELEPEVIQPAVYAEELEKQTFKIASFYTVVTGTEARKSNVFHAARQFNGMIVQPGQVVSFNATTGERTVANGYKKAPVIMPDKSLQDELGGGVCQTSSTIYNAIVRAGLKIEERWHHSFPSTYVDIGHDATVNWPNVDFKFSNNKDTPIYIHTYRDGNKLYVDVYGEPDPGYDNVKLESDIYASYKAPDPKIVQDKDGEYVTYKDETYTKIQSRPGYKVKTWRVFYKDGKEVNRELVSDDYYRPITGTVYVGVKDRPAPQETQQPQE
ncbi:MAG TPA: hypothetical protein GX505_13365 [Clostridiales bacterium]|nr:hypothetical protein [Clostridiales bacterium]